ncbi:hypothetical protein PIB30_095795 [Stylosanthes scabra]|uniref:Uncharacterized protein n=1 Tax=Stylosanthes scabra TaxID=79078 RepID=A0ABU6VVK8_9FABA|nr:hypothetical protein [Stylosanthes scabra]
MSIVGIIKFKTLIILAPEIDCQIYLEEIDSPSVAAMESSDGATEASGRDSSSSCPPSRLAANFEQRRWQVNGDHGSIITIASPLSSVTFHRASSPSHLPLFFPARQR